MADFWSGYLLPFIIILGKILLIVVPMLLAMAYLTLAERKVMGWMQIRRGPNVVGPFGLLQPLADGAKLFFKETILPTGSDKAIFVIAPMLTFILALIGWAVIPFDEGWVLADINVGVLYLFAVSSLGVYGIVMAGWASNSRYAFLGAMRSAAQMVSYEVSIGFVIITVLLCAGTLNLSEIVAAQSNAGVASLLGLENGGILGWYFIPLFPMFIIFFISALAETNRHPFDLPEAEAELVAGYQTEYSSMTFALFFLGEYMNMILMSGLTVILFLGGWHSPIPGETFVPGIIWFALKISMLLFVFIWVRATLPRYRYDQLMRLGWKVFLPISLAAVVIYSGILVYAGWLPGMAS
ncbi:NADH-quinone oxidoreductase subunit NuoH [Minwuia thermotolerans]|jgi:NADH-quinone oxidoreductase subunit H|uniref:NADH-quinone oxidoreductase subunit H n=1 Tax=Minwuia thermotolerans TaxID=2056226 RepID=A0A2M9G1Q3_9PROT|nr:NADH-quinone oxidoreductase subunit NuoH [Minwuia thermotolerans]ANK81189.1 MAG: NADH-quinone oxidoreductase subunit H [Rhizobiales bacterium NRL2]PJK29647.1 NADH-quinone oxidoreductase subunit NuoH [Minwuia thermotolerans]